MLHKGRQASSSQTRRALLAAALAWPLLATTAPATQAAEPFDGQWTVQDLKLSGGMCTGIRIRHLTVRDGSIDVTGHGPYIGRIVASGAVDANGEAAVKGYLGAHFLMAMSGRFDGRNASGEIDFFGKVNDCSGTWQAERTS